MNFFIFLFLTLLIIPFYSQARMPSSPQEVVIFKNFAGFFSAKMYDKICNGHSGNYHNDLSNSKNVNIVGNEQMLSARIGGVIKIMNPEFSADQVIKIMISMKDDFSKKSEKMLRERGCDSDEAKKLSIGYRIFSEYHPAKVHALIDSSIKKEGGTVMSHDEIEKLINSKDKK